MKSIKSKKAIIISLAALLLIILCVVLNKESIIAMHKNNTENQAISEKYKVEDSVVLDEKHQYVYGTLFYNTFEKQFCEYINNTFTPISQYEKEKHIIYDGVEGNIYYRYCIYNNNKYVMQEFKEQEGNGELFPIEIHNNNAYIFYLNNPTHAGSTNRYPLEFDLDTGEYKDFLSDVTIDGKKLREYEYVNQWQIADEYMYVTVNLKSSELKSSELKSSSIYRINLRDYSIKKVKENAFSIVDINESKGKYDIIQTEEKIFLKNLEDGTDTKINLSDSEEIIKLCINNEGDKLLIWQKSLYLMDLNNNKIYKLEVEHKNINNIDFVNNEDIITVNLNNNQETQVIYYVN